MLNFFKKKVSHSVLAVLLVIFIVADIKIPTEVSNLIDTLFGRVAVAGLAICLLMCHPLLGVLGIVAGYELLRRAEESAAGGSNTNSAWSAAKGAPPSVKYVPSEKNKQRHFDSMNQFPVTLEETVIHNMIPFVSGQSNTPPSFRPTLDSLHDAAKIE
tara:strand:+ start:76 stop:549 length:474 start_codon:yes stop_codon:yes gene_type:complete